MGNQPPKLPGVGGGKPTPPSKPPAAQTKPGTPSASTPANKPHSHDPLAHHKTSDLPVPVDLGEKHAPEKRSSKDDENPERQTLYEHLVAFYFRHDNTRLMNGEVDVDGIVDWTLSAGDEGMDALNARLLKKYGQDLDLFLLALAEEPFDNEDSEDEEEEEPAEEEAAIAATAASLSAAAAALAHPSEPFPGEGGDAKSGADAVLSRPTIPGTRRRPTLEGIKLDENGQVIVHPDHPAPPDLKTQLTAFLADKSKDKDADLAKFLKLAADHGLVALNSELLAKFGADLKGDSVVAAQEHHDATKFGVAMDNKILAEMQTHQLKHDSDSERSLEPDASHACSKFRLDTKSANFGVCKCGFDRNAHLLQMSKGSAMSGSLRRKLEKRAAVDSSFAAAPAAKASPQVVAKRAPAPAAAAPAVVATAAAPAVVVAAKRPTPPKTKRPPSEKRPVSRKAVGGMERLESHGLKAKAPKACGPQEFHLDLGASEFGVCANCGWKKAEHVALPDAPPAPAPPRPMSVRKDGPPEPCKHYKLDINAETFGVCVCGFPRQAHSGQSSSTTNLSKTLEKRWGQVKLS